MAKISQTVPLNTGIRERGEKNFFLLKIITSQMTTNISHCTNLNYNDHTVTIKTAWHFVTKIECASEQYS